MKPESIKVASYNVLNDCWVKPCKPLFEGKWNQRKVELVNRICNLQADVIGLQEAYGFDDLAHLLYQKGYTGYRVKDRDVAIFYRSDRFKVLQEHSLYYPDQYYRSALMLKLQTADGAIFNVLSTHITWKQPEDILEMRQLEEFVKKQQEPVIVCGDLNAGPEWQPIQELCKKGFRDTLRNSDKKTYIDQNRRLDYVLVSKGIHVHAADVNGDPRALNAETEPSDHLPITADLTIPYTYRPPKEEIRESQLFEAFNEEARQLGFSQSDYDQLVPFFQNLINKTEKNALFLEHLHQQIDTLEGKTVLRNALRRYEHQELQRIVSLFKDAKSDTAIAQFSQLPEKIRRSIYFSLYEIEKRKGRNISDDNFGENAFHKKSHEISHAVRFQAIERFLLREVQQLFKDGKEDDAFEIFEELSKDPFRNAIYAQTYFAARKANLKIDHSDFGKVAFHRLENIDVPNDMRIAALQMYFENTEA